MTNIEITETPGRVTIQLLPHTPSLASKVLCHLTQNDFSQLIPCWFSKCRAYCYLILPSPNPLLIPHAAHVIANSFCCLNGPLIAPHPESLPWSHRPQSLPSLNSFFSCKLPWNLPFDCLTPWFDLPPSAVNSRRVDPTSVQLRVSSYHTDLGLPESGHHGSNSTWDLSLRASSAAETQSFHLCLESEMASQHPRCLPSFLRTLSVILKRE